MKREKTKKKIQEKIIQKKQVALKKEIPSMKFETFFNKYSVIFLVSIISIIGFIAFKDFFTTKLLFFFTDIGSDSINQDLPAIIHGADYAGNSFFEKWSFYQGTGNQYYKAIPVEPLGLFAYFTDYIAYSLFGSDFFISGRFIRLFIFNFLLSGIIFYYYLRTVSINKYSSLIGALFIAFSGYMVMGSSWGFSGHIFRAVFLLFAFEQLYVKKRWFFFPFAVVYASGNIMILYLYSLFILTYSLFRFWSKEDAKLKAYSLLAGKMILLGIVGLLMNFINVSRNFAIMFFSPRVAGNSSMYETLTNKASGVEYSSHNATALLRFFSNDILGSGTNFTGWHNYFEAPAFYVGIIFLLIFTQIYTILNKRSAILLGGLCLFWISTIFIPDFRYAILLYTGDYYRFGFDFFIPFLILFSGVYSMNKIISGHKINIYTLFGTLIFLLIILFFPYKSIEANSINTNIRNIVVLLLISYSALIFLISKPKYKSIAQIVLLLLFVTELSYFSYKSYADRESITKSEYKADMGGYKDGTIKAVKHIKSIDKTPFFRTEKDYQSGNAMHGSLNDAMAQGYYGTTSYSSFNQINYVRFLEETGLIQKGDETATRWLTGLRDSPLLQTFGNVKYHLSKSKNPEFSKFGFDSITTENGITILKNRYALPFGYTYDKYIDSEDFKTLINYQITTQSLTNIYQDLFRTVEQQKLNQIISKLQTALNIKNTDINDLQDVITKQLGSEDADKYKMTIAKYSTSNFKSQIVLLSGFVYEKEFNKDININDFEKINLNDSNIIVPASGFNFDIYKDKTDKLKLDTLQITEFSQSNIKGKISLPKTKMLFFTIPFDKGWKIKINNKEESLSRVNFGFTGIVLPKGEHLIELYYIPEYSKLTKYISLITIIGFWLYIGYLIVLRRKKLNAKKTQ